LPPVIASCREPSTTGSLNGESVSENREKDGQVRILTNATGFSKSLRSTPTKKENPAAHFLQDAQPGKANENARY